MNTLKEMRSAAQSANKKGELWVPENYIFISASDCLADSNFPATLVSNNMELHQLALSVNQLCDEVMRLRAALDYYANGKNWYGPGAPFNEDKSRKMIIASVDTEGDNWLGGRTARAALKESNERFGEWT